MTVLVTAVVAKDALSSERMDDEAKSGKLSEKRGQSIHVLPSLRRNLFRIISSTSFCSNQGVIFRRGAETVPTLNPAEAKGVTIAAQATGECLLTVTNCGGTSATC